MLLQTAVLELQLLDLAVQRTQLIFEPVDADEQPALILLDALIARLIARIDVGRRAAVDLGDALTVLRLGEAGLFGPRRRAKGRRGGRNKHQPIKSSHRPIRPNVVRPRIARRRMSPRSSAKFRQVGGVLRTGAHVKHIYAT